MADAKKQKKEKVSFGNVLKDVRFSLRFLLKYAPVAFIIQLTQQIFWSSFINAAYVLLLKYLFESITMGARLGSTLLFIGTYLLAEMVGQLIDNWLLFGPVEVAYNRVYYQVHKTLYEKAVAMDLACYEDPAFFNDYILVLDGAGERICSMASDFSWLIGRLVGLGTLAAVVATISPGFLFLPLLAALLSFLAGLWQNRLNFGFTKQRKPLERERDYYGRVLYLPEYAKEVRLSGAPPILMTRFRGVIDRLKEYDRSKAVPLVFAQFVNNFVVADLIATLGTTAYALYQVLVAHSITVAEASALISSTERISGTAQSLIRSLTRIQEHALYVEKVRTFLATEPKIRSGERMAPEGPATLEVRGVSFSYLGAEEPALRNVSLTVRPGERVALVGYNGAGKTTLIKLLLRLYDPTEGVILLDGHDLREYDIPSLRAYFGCVFQDFALFAATLGENVLCREAGKEDEPLIRRALALSGFEERLASLEQGVDTPLTREFDKSGVNLSGGENQKVALARTFAKPSGCIILDEPSAALDPISEYNMNQSMNEAAAGRTVIFISHRLSTTRMADRICMMEQGRIIEEGPHDELMERDGKYAAMFRTQASRYVEEEETAE